MIETALSNPYQTPETTSVLAEEAAPLERDWKGIAVRWEKLRIAFNAVLAFPGLLALAGMGSRLTFMALAEATAYAFMANVAYTLGPIAQMYLDWIAEVGEGRWWSSGWRRMARSWPLTLLMFFVGTAFAVVLTSIIAMMSYFPPDQD